MLYSPTLEADWRSCTSQLRQESSVGSRANFGPKYLKAPASLPFGGEAGLGAPFPEIPSEIPDAMFGQAPA